MATDKNKSDEIEIFKRTGSIANMSFKDLIESEGYFTRVKSVLSNLSFAALCISLSGLFYVVTGIQYWFSEYLKKEFGSVASDESISFAFAFTCFTAPLCGAVAGAITTSKLGGYNNISA